MELNIIFEQIHYFREDFFSDILNVIIKYLGKKEGFQEIINRKLIINLMIIDDENMKKLNKTWRNKDKTTDVLSFPYMENFTTSYKHLDVFGEIFISLPQCKLQADLDNNSIEIEFKKLFIHGVLHLFGYDHITDKDFLKMEKEEKIIKTLV